MRSRTSGDSPFRPTCSTSSATKCDGRTTSPPCTAQPAARGEPDCPVLTSSRLCTARAEHAMPISVHRHTTSDRRRRVGLRLRVPGRRADRRDLSRRPDQRRQMDRIRTLDGRGRVGHPGQPARAARSPQLMWPTPSPPSMGYFRSFRAPKCCCPACGNSTRTSQPTTLGDLGTGGPCLAMRVFADEELERLREFPEIGRDELARFFTLSPADAAFVDPGRGRFPGSLRARRSLSTASPSAPRSVRSESHDGHCPAPAHRER